MRVLKAASAIALTLFAYAVAMNLPPLALAILDASVGAGKIRVVAVGVLPVLLLLLGWSQGRRMFLLHLTGVLVVWLEAWRFKTFYDPNDHVGTLAKELSYHTLTIAFLVFLVCAVASAIRNARLVWAGETIVLRFPMRGEVPIL